MEEGSRVQLETHWHSIDEHYSYSEWEVKRHEDWQHIISHRLPELGKSIAVDSGLFTYLQSKAVFDRRTIETFKVSNFVLHPHTIDSICVHDVKKTEVARLRPEMPRQSIVQRHDSQDQ